MLASDLKYSFFFLWFFCHANFAVAQFNLVGQAYEVSDSCFVLTESENNKVGAFWFLEKVDLNESFSVKAELYFGSNDDGADGIVFALQPLSNNTGSAGGGIGIEGVNPSLFVEMDTWQNTDRSDPSYDHISLMKNGSLNHNSSNNIVGPVAAMSGNGNVENDEYYKFQVNWNNERQMLDVFFDCKKVLTYEGDLINEIFNGDPKVFWGFTAATGGARNKHIVCLKYASFESKLADVVLCRGGKTQLNAIGGVEYFWSPSEGLSEDNISNPIASPLETTTYTVEIVGECGEVVFDEVEIIVDGSLTDLDIGPDTSLCDFEDLFLTVDLERATAYNWSNGSTEQSIEVFSSGLYSVTVTVDDECITEDWIKVEVTKSPIVDLGTDTILCTQSTEYILSNGFNDGVFIWNEGSMEETLTVSSPGFYSLNIENDCGSAFDEVFIDFEDCRSLYIPNAFSPNGDGINDFFHLHTDGDIIEAKLFKIFDRWGTEIYSNNGSIINGSEVHWDGKLRSQVLPPDVYLYFIKVLYRDGIEELFFGDVSIVK